MHMEKQPTPQSPERDYAYYIDHPEELTSEEVNRFGFFFNNFPSRIFAKDSNPISPNRAELYAVINDSIAEIGFDFELFKEKMSAWNALRAKLNQQGVATAEEDQRTELIKRMDEIAKDISPMVLDLYKVLRKRGLDHSRLTS